MQDNNSFDENNSSKKSKKIKKNKKFIEDNICKEKEKNSKKSLDDKNNILKTDKQIEIQKKLKHIFNEVRAKGKYEYNKQEIPEHLKYHSDSDSSEFSKTKKSDKKLNIKENSIKTKKGKIKKDDIPSGNTKKSSKVKDNNNIKESEVKECMKDISNNKEKTNLKKEKKFNNVRDIIEKLKAKKNEKEDLARLEREAEEQSIMREKINKKKNENLEEKINESEIEKEAEKIRKKEKKMEERRLAREKRRKMEEEEKIRKEKEFEERKRKEEKRKEDERKKSLEKELENIKKRKNSDFKKDEETNKNDYKVYVSGKKKINNIKNKIDAIGTYKKPNQKSLVNDKIYRPKKAIGAVKGRSQEKIRKNSMINKKLNEKFCKSPNITYSKKKSLDGLRENNFIVLNKSFGDFRPNFEKETNFLNNNGRYNINTFDITSLPDLNSSFDSRLLNLNNNFQFNINNNDFYKRTAQKNYNNSTINSGNITNSSNRFANMNNIFNLNGLSYMNGENDFINMSNNNFNNNNNSFFDLLHPQISPYDLNSSYSIGYANPLANYTYNNNQMNLSNLLNNNYMGMNNLNNSLNFNEIFSKNNSSINIEDLLVLEEKLSEIINALNTTKDMQNECFDFLNYYYNCSLNGSLEKLFTNIIDSNNVKMSIKYILISILICYDCSFDVDILNKVYSILKDLLNLNHKNLILIYEHILSKISTDNKENIWVIKLLTLVNSSKNNDFDYSFNFNEYNAVNEYPMSLIEKINFNTGIIIQNVRVLLKNYKTPKVEYLTILFKKINDKSYEEINNFYQQNILRIENYSGSILDSIILKQNKNVTFNPEPSPYIHTINHKQYTLILDLGETLVHFKVNPENEGEGILKVRPWVTEFLNEMVKFYEIIIFTGATQDYANLLIDAIDENKNYFDYRLYRQHMIILDNEFVKDLTRIGRPLDKVVIVDNMPQNFRLQKENGINIKSFWGEDIYDTALINLTTILTKIAQEGGDIRKGLEKYRDEIVEKVTSNLSKHNS